MNIRRSLMPQRRTLWAPWLVVAAVAGLLFGDEPRAITDAEFVELHGMIRPQPGESRWMEIDWHPSVWEARQKAAAEGKPIFIMAGSGGAPVAGC
jgi:hypothetical protein